ncbi:MAG TPA: MlrC C-terminal domain-containing protein, partial [Bordetella sp.]
PHCHITPAMRGGADFLVAFKEYPHTDVVERGLDLVDLCVAKAQGKIQPAHAIVDTGMIATIRTPQEPARGFVDRIKAMEGKDGVLSISIGHGFPWGDVADMGTRVLVYTDNDPAKAQALARRLADELIALRDALDTPMPGIEEALDQAMAMDGTVILADSADNPGGGAAGDSTFILRRLVERGIAPAAVGPVWDPVAVRIACDAGEGATLDLRIGGKISPASGDPMDLRCTVKAIRPGMTMTGLTGTPMAMGDCVLVEARGIEIVLASIRNQAMGTDVFTKLGCDLAAKKLIVVKSSQHFYASFAKVSTNVVYVAAPGAVTRDIATLPYRNIRRPKWPLDA